MRRIASTYEPDTGFTNEMWYDDATGRVTIQRLQDVEGTLAANKAAFNLHSSNPTYRDSDGLHHVARIPLVVIEQWFTEGFNWYRSTDAERRAKLNDYENSKFLVRPGKL